MDLLNNLSLEFGVALTVNIIYALIGCLLGTLIGVLPGIGRWQPSRCCCRRPTLPAAGICADHAGRHLLRRAVRRFDNCDPRQICRWSSSVVLRPVYQMARRGRAGATLGMAAWLLHRGFVLGAARRCFAPPLSEAALKFRPC